MLNTLRAELAARSPCEASACASWAACATWLRTQGHVEIAEWLELELAGVRGKQDRGRRRALIERVLKSRDELVRRLWRGELGWSLWLGPFMLAYVGPPTPDSQQLREALGVLGSLLADERVWIHGDPDPRRLPELEPGVPVLIERTLPGTQTWIYAHLLRELREQLGELALEGRALEIRGRGPWRAPPPPVEGWAVVSLENGETMLSLDWNRVSELTGVAVVGPPELLSRWRDPGRRQPSFAPRPSFEARYQRLGARHPALFERLRAELDERPLAEAHTCPSWPVFGDWLLEQGDELLAEWLRLDLDQRSGKPVRPRELTRLLDALVPLRPPEAAALRHLWGRRDSSPDAVRSIWLGPFMLAHVDPQVFDGIGADELQATLGRHAAFLPRSRVYTGLDRRWIEQALTPRRVPVLAPTPGSTSIFGRVLLDLHEDDGQLARRLRVASPGHFMEVRAEQTFATNIGPIAADDDATAVLCCETEDDLRRHAKRWDHLQTFEHLVLLGSEQVLAGWPHPGEWIEPWRSKLDLEL